MCVCVCLRYLLPHCSIVFHILYPFFCVCMYFSCFQPLVKHLECWTVINGLLNMLSCHFLWGSLIYHLECFKYFCGLSKRKRCFWGWVIQIEFNSTISLYFKFSLKFYFFIQIFHWLGWLTRLIYLLNEQHAAWTSDIKVKFMRNLLI